MSGTHLWMAEAGQTSVGVSLAIAPPSDVTVNVARTAGDADVGVSAGAALTFTPANWSVPQAVTIAAADDLDTTADGATVTVSSSGLASEDIVVRVIDDDANNFIVSRTALSVREGGSDTFLVALVKAPPATLTVTIARTAGDADIGVTAGATLTFDVANHFDLQLRRAADGHRRGGRGRGHHRRHCHHLDYGFGNHFPHGRDHGDRRRRRTGRRDRRQRSAGREH